MKKLIVLVLFLSTLKLSAQIAQNNSSLNELFYYVETNKRSYEGIEGSPYLNPEFKPARINDISQTVLVRLNAADKLIEVKKSNGAIINLAKSRSYTLQFLDGSKKRYRVRHYTIEGESKPLMLELIHKESRFELYLEEKIKFVKDKKARSYEPAVPAHFKDDGSAYYLAGLNKDSLSHLVALPQRRKPFSQIFKADSKKVDTFIKKEKLDLNDRDDLLKIMLFYFDEQ